TPSVRPIGLKTPFCASMSLASTIECVTAPPLDGCWNSTPLQEERFGESPLERQSQPRQLFDHEPALDRRLDVERLADLRVLADQLARLARHRLLRCLRRLPQIDRAPPLGR